MKCSICDSKVVSNNLCKSHFLEYVENNVKETISRFNLLNKKDKICVAVSGGKDSVVLLHLLHKFGYDVSALSVDEGIKGYREEVFDYLKDFCESRKIPLILKSFKEDFGHKLDDVASKGTACSICGTFRRFLLNKYSQGFDKVATGHNLDDEAQAVFMNLFKAQTDLFDRQGPITREVKGFSRKIKPLYFLKEKEILVYSELMNFKVIPALCPYASSSFRWKTREFINGLESKLPDVKKNIVERFLEVKKSTNDSLVISSCNICGFPSDGDVCKACRLKESFSS